VDSPERQVFRDAQAQLARPDLLVVLDSLVELVSKVELELSEYLERLDLQGPPDYRVPRV